MKRTIKITKEQLDRINELYDDGSSTPTSTPTGATGKPTVSVQTAQSGRFSTGDAEVVRKEIETNHNKSLNITSEGRKRGSKVVKLSQLFK